MRRLRRQPDDGFVDEVCIFPSISRQVERMVYPSSRTDAASQAPS
jgi:hypothetical protein